MLLLMILPPTEGREKITAFFAAQHDYLYRVAYRFLQSEQDAEDAVQSAFLKMVEQYEKLQKLPCHKFLPFCVIIVKNSSRDILRKRKHEKPVPRMDETAQAVQGVEDCIAHAEDVALVASLLGKLSPAAAQLLRLRYMEGYSSREVSQLLGVPDSTVRKREERALRKLRELYGEEGLR